MPKIVVVGSSNTDMMVKIPHIPTPGETVLGGEFLMAAGGERSQPGRGRGPDRSPSFTAHGGRGRGVFGGTGRVV